MYDEHTDIAALQERYPSPADEQIVSDPPIIHHGVAFGAYVPCIAAIREGLDIARKRKDTGAIAHLSAHLADYKKWSESNKSWQELTHPKALRPATGR